MNTKKIGTTVGIGVMLVAMLSMLAIPASAASTSWSRGYNCGDGTFYVYAVGYYDPGNPSVFTSGNTYPLYTSCYSVDSYGDTIDPAIVYADGIGTCTTCGLHVEATAWVSPLTYPLTHGGSVDTWY